MRRRVLYSVISILIIFAGIFYTVIDTPWVSTWLIRQAIKKKLPDWQIQSIRISRQEFHFPDHADFYDIQLSLKNQVHSLTTDIKKISLNGFAGLLKEKNQMNLAIQGLDFGMENIKVDRLDLTAQMDFQQRKLGNLNGQTTIEKIELSAYHMSHIIGDIVGNGKEVELRNLVSDFYDGKMQGHISVEYQDELPYRIELEFVDIDLKRLEEVKTTDHSQMEGTAKGLLHVDGDRHQLHFLEAQLDATEGAKIKAELLDFIAQYIPPSQQKKEFELLVKAGKKLPLDVASFHFKSTDNGEKISGLTRMYSRKLNVDLNLPIDFNVKGGFKALFSSDYYAPLISRFSLNELIVLIFQSLKKEDVWKKP